MRFVEACEWLDPDPKDGTIAPDDSTNITLNFNTVNDEGEVLLPGTYYGDLVITCNDPETPTKIVDITMTVIADDLAVTPNEGLAAGGPVGGPFNPDSMVYTLTNTGPLPIDWTAQGHESWLIVYPLGGTLASSESTELHVGVGQIAKNLVAGVYTDNVIITNMASGNTRTRVVTLHVGQQHYFTELFEENDNDLDNQVLSFMPNDLGSSYRVCREVASAFATDPAGGTNLELDDEDYAEVILTGGATVQLYGTSYTSLYVGSNGYITFTGGDTDYSESLDDHFRIPRISALFDDLSPQSGGTISFKQLDDRVAVTFENVPEYYGAPETNSFQIEMFFEGIIRMTWLSITAEDGLAGLSAGGGLPGDFFEDDLSAYGSCWTPGDFDHDNDVDMEDFGHLQVCLTGKGNTQNDPFCKDAMLDLDNDVDD